MRNVPDIIEAIVDHIEDPFPDLPRSGFQGWQDIAEGRPCIERMRQASRVKSHRNPMLYSIAVELRRRGWSQDEVLKSCLSVNENAFLRSKPESEVRGIVRSAFKRKVPQSCFDALLQRYCIGADNCVWAKRARYGERSPDPVDEAVFDQNWFSRLRPPVRELYLYLVNLEKKFNVAPGMTLTRSFRQIGQDLRYPDKGTVIRSARKLAELGLIRLVVPKLRRRADDEYGFDTRFSRVIPVPMPGRRDRQGGSP